MARGRMISTTVKEDFRLNALPIEAHLLYMMTIPHLDRDGLIAGHPAILGGNVCPLRNDLLSKVAESIQAWVDCGLVIRYNTSNGPVLYFAGFQKNQNLGSNYVKEGKSRYPAPPDFVRTDSGLIPADSVPENELVGSNSGVSRELVGSNSGVTPAEGNEKECKEIQHQHQRAAAAVFACYADNMDDAKTTDGKWKPIIRKELTTLVECYGQESVIWAIGEAVTGSGKSIKYVRKVLENRANGIGPPRKPDPTGGASWSAWEQLTPGNKEDGDD